MLRKRLHQHMRDLFESAMPLETTSVWPSRLATAAIACVVERQRRKIQRRPALGLRALIAQARIAEGGERA